ncbi:hypothetical protein NAEGRDRAFT_81001 [Naegleria gruberi]|uniref:Uncharacterized protein n=1 Tax=Naegleria gruberi TaxID=5762 RepID=D2VRS3_NAEGR|nr:uncharacterized protein NAEGRDRAFT_81001 [Naegleria gruberi]EFC40441.1 hypothetical protein NAEGRDRAFT_81001 [Naegleria gruberi]|eukprot:XP_002673185.1 hypothetical protein NAEGRDRAFT_81001 [Naegleria gruberi strain NEG-M]
MNMEESLFGKAKKMLFGKTKSEQLLDELEIICKDRFYEVNNKVLEEGVDEICDFIQNKKKEEARKIFLSLFMMVSKNPDIYSNVNLFQVACTHLLLTLYVANNPPPVVFKWISEILVTSAKDYSKFAHNIRKIMLLSGLKNFEFEYVLVLHQFKNNHFDQWNIFWKKASISAELHDWVCEYYFRVFPNNWYHLEITFSSIIQPQNSKYLPIYVSSLLQRSPEYFTNFWKNYLNNLDMTKEPLYIFCLQFLCYNIQTFLNDLLLKQKLISSLATKEILDFSENTLQSILQTIQQYGVDYYLGALEFSLKNNAKSDNLTPKNMRLAIKYFPNQVSNETFMIFLTNQMKKRASVDVIFEMIDSYMNVNGLDLQRVLSFYTSWFGLTKDFRHLQIFDILESKSIESFISELDENSAETIVLALSNLFNDTSAKEARLKSAKQLFYLGSDNLTRHHYVFYKAFINSLLDSTDMLERLRIVSLIADDMSTSKLFSTFAPYLLENAIVNREQTGIKFFLDSEKYLNIFINTWKHNQNSKEWKEYRDLFVSAVKNPLQDLTDSISDNQITIKDLELLQKERYRFNSLIEKLDLAKVNGIERKIETSKSVEKDIQELTKIISWLKRFPLLMEFTQHLSLLDETSTLSELESNVESLKAQLDYIDNRRDLIIFLHDEDSLLFHSLFKKFLHDSGETGDIIAVSEIFTRVIEFLEHINMQNIQSLKEYEILDLSKQLRAKGKTLSGEIELLSSVLNKTSSGGQFNINLEVLRKALNLEELGTGLEYFVDCMQDYNMELVKEESFNNIKRLKDRLYGLRDIPLSEVEVILDVSNEAMQGLDGYHTKYFKDLLTPESKGLIQFLKDNLLSFEDSIKVVRTRSRNSKFHEEIVNSLIIAKELVSPLLNQKITFQDFRNKILALFNKEEDLFKLKELQVVNENLTTIKILFSSTATIHLDDVFDSVRAIIEKGKFISTPDSLIVSYEDKEISGEELVDLVRVAIFRSSDSENDQNIKMKHDLQNFILLYQMAEQIQSTIKELIKEGYPKYHDQERIEINERMEKLELEKKNNAFNAKLEKWKKSIEDLVESQPLVLNLSRSQLTKFVSLFKDSLESEERECQSLIPYIMLIVKELFRDNLKHYPITEEGLKEILSGFKSTTSAKEILKLSGEFVQKIIESIAGDLDQERNNYETKTLYDVNGSQIPIILLKIFQENIIQYSGDNSVLIVNNSNIFYCDESTRKEDIQWFCKRRKAFPELTYALVHVNKLVLSVKEELIKFEFEAHEKNQKVGLTTLIFTSDASKEAFSFIETKNDIEGMAQKKPIISKYLSESCKIEKFETVKGESASGKTRYIQSEKRDNEVYVRIAVHEEFSYDYFYEQLCSYDFENSPKVLIHFDVSYVFELRNFELFLLEWIFGRCLQSKKGQLVDTWGNTKESIRIFVEIPSSFEKVKLDLISLIETTIGPKSLHSDLASFDFGEEKTRYVASMFTLFNSKKINDINRFLNVDKNLVSEEKSRQVLTQFFSVSKVTKSHSLRKIFIELMYERLRGLENYHIKFLKLKESNEFGQDIYGNAQELIFTINGTLFPVFKEECEVMTDNTIERCWSDLPVVFAVPNLTDDIPNYNIVRCSKCSTTREYIGMQPLDVKTSTLAEIRSILTSSFEVNSIIEICEKTNYLLTKDFAIKLFLLDERRKVGRSVIIESETGVGKSELLRFYSNILNSNNKLLPDIRFELRKWLCETVDQFTSKNNIQTEVRTKNMDKCRSREYIVKLLKETEEQVGQQLLQEITISLVSAVKKIFDEFKLIEKTDLINSTFEALEQQNYDLWTVDMIADFLAQAESARPENSIYFKILMHSGISSQEIRQTIRDIERNTLRLINSGYQDLKVVVFIDELNTSSCMGIMKELFVDHTLDGQLLPKSIFFVGAINPKLQNEEYVVNEIAPSMKLIRFNYADLSKYQEQEFLALLIELEQKKRDEHEGFVHDLQTFILSAQRFVAESKQLDKRIRVSIRDLTRACKLYWFLKDNEVLYYSANLSIEQCHIICLYMALALSYYFRLPSSERTKFEEMIDREAHTQVQYGIFAFSQVVSEQLGYFYQKAKQRGFIPPGIASTKALLENFFTMVIGIQVGIGISCVGPPGNSKTLSYTIATQKKKSLFVGMKTVHTQHYQCNELSTANEIELVVKSQVETRRKYERAGMVNEICSVLIDEASLPIEKKNSLKVLHYYLDKPTISTVLISNNLLDAAKSNRCIQIVQPETSFEDLRALCQGCLMLNEDDIKPNSRIDRIITALCKSFKEVNYVLTSTIVKQHNGTGGIFHLRDFVYFLRMLSKNKGNHKEVFSGNNIYYCLQRNFNGVPENDFQKIQELFLTNINEMLGTKIHIEKEKIKQYIDVVYDSIHDSLSKYDDPNQSHYRHTMIIDPSQAQASIKLLTSNNIIDQSKTKVVYISDFKGDTNDLSLSQEISEVKNCMELGAPVVLVNSSAISTNFFDVFNKHFTKVNDRYFANVSIKGKTHPCEINSSFHCIVHVPIAQYRELPLPFLNRFEKYIIGAERVLKSDLLVEKEESKKAIFDHIRRGVNDFVRQFDASTFYGLVEDETVDLLIKSIYQQSKDSIQIKKPLTIKNNNIIELLKENGMEDNIDLEEEDEEISINKLRSYIRKINFQLLQIAKPEDIFLRRKFIPKSYLVEYLTKQEHFCTISFLKNAIDQHFKQSTTNNSKYILYTRHSSGIHTLNDTDRLKEITSVACTSEPLKSCVNNPSEIITLASLSSFSSQLEFHRFLGEFAADHQKLVLLLTIDMSMISKNTVNFVKFKIENILSSPMKKVKNMTPFVSLILYFPPESSHFNAAYDSIFLGWDYYYIDSLRGDLGDGQISQYRDSRYWFSVAVGLLKGFRASDKQAFQNSFIPLYNKLLEDYIRSDNTAVASGSLSPFFMRRNINKLVDKKKFILTNINKLELLRDIVLNMFADRWNNQFLSQLVQKICTDITSGKIVNGIIQTISYELSSVLEEMMYPITRKLIYLTPSVQKILNVEDQSTLCLLRKLIEVFITTNKKKSKSSDILHVSTYQSTNEHLPLSTLLIEKMILNEKSDNLDEVVEMIENDKENFEKFRLDMISFYFEKDITKEDQAIRLVDILISPIWNSAEGKKSMRLLSHLSQTKVKNSIKILLNVLSQFKSINFLTDEFKKHLQGKQLHECLEVIFTYILDYVYKNIGTALEEKDLDSINSWMSELSSINFMYIKDIAPKYFKSSRFSILFLVYYVLKGWVLSEEQIEYLWKGITELYKNPTYLPDNFIDIYNCFKDTVTTFLDPNQQSIWINNVTRFAFVHIIDIWSAPSLTNFFTIISQYEKDENSIFKQLNIGLITSITKTIMARYLQNKFNQNMTNVVEQELNNYSDENFVPEELSSKKQPFSVLLLQSSYLSHHSQSKWETFLPLFTRHQEDGGNSKLSKLITQANNILLITKLSSHLLKDDDPQKTIENMDAETCELITNVMKQENMALYFLSRYTSDVELEMILTTNRGELGRIGLANFHIPSIKKNFKSHHFSFMHDNNQVYTDLKRHIESNNIQQIHNFINTNAAQHKYFIRMCLIVISYNFYFLECKSCDAVLAILQDRNVLNTLSIDDSELKAFVFFATKPVSLPVEKQDDWFASYYFSQEFINSNRDKMLTHLLANITATNVGVPKEKNHLYNRMFNPQVLANSFGPGSTYQDRNWDCGYTSSGYNINNIESHNIMNRNQTYHSALNSLTWASFVMCVIFDPAKNENAAKGGHMCNCIDDVKFRPNLSNLEQLQTYIKIRADTFCSIFAHSPNIIGNVDPIIFFTSSLEEFTKQAPNSNDCFGFFANNNTPTIRAYENFWMNSCFIPTLNRYANIVGKMNAGQKLLQDIGQFKERSLAIRKCVDLFPSRENILAFFSQRYTDIEDNAELMTVRQIVKHKDWLLFSYYFIDFLSFYVKLHRGLNGKIERDSIHMTVKDALTLITKDKSKQEEEAIYESWECFKKSWNIVSEKQERNIVCQHANQAEIPIIDENSILSHLLYVEGGNNEIGTLLLTIYNAQSDIQQGHSFPDTIDAAYVMELDDVFYKLLFSKFEDDNFFENIQYYVTINNGDINFDWKSLESYFVESLSKGRPRLLVKKDQVISPQAICKFKEDIPIEEDLPDEIIQEDSLSLDTYASELNTLIEKMNSMDISWKTFDNTKKKSFMNSLNFRDTKKILQIAKDTCQAATNLIGKVPFKSFSIVNSEREILGFSEFVLDIIYNRDEVKSLYDKFSSTFRIPMSTSTKEKFERITLYTMKMVETSNPELDNFLSDLRTIATVIYNNEKDIVNAYASMTTASLRTVFESQIQVKNHDNLAQILPNYFLVKNLVPYIENIRRLIGKIELKKSSMKTENYQELVPDNLKTRPESPIDPLDSLISKVEEPEEEEEIPQPPPMFNVMPLSNLPIMRPNMPSNNYTIDPNQMNKIKNLMEQAQNEKQISLLLQPQLLDNNLLLRLVELLEEAEMLTEEGKELQQAISTNQTIILQNFNKLR